MVGQGRPSRLWPAVRLGLAAAALLSAAGSLRAQEVTAQIEPGLVAVGGTADLTIAVDANGLGARVDEPALPELPAEVAVVARGREARVEMRGLDVRRSTVFRYTLRGLAPGTARIDPIAVQVGERTLHTEPLVLLVVGEIGPAEARRALPGGPPIFVSTRVDRQRAWLGQQVTLTFAFYHDPSSPLAESPDYDPPQTPGFWRVELSDAPEITSERVGDRTYQVQRFRYALFPLQPGIAEIGPARVRVVQPDTERWWEPGRPRVLATDPLLVTVDELPPGAPEGFGGAVGRYSLSGELPVTQANAGSPIELALTVRGSGNPATVDAPELPGWPDIDVGAPSVETESDVAGSRLEGRAIFRWILIPRSDGTLDLGAARLPYFDPDRGTYAVDTLRLGELRIRPSPAAPMAAGQEPRGPTLWQPREPRDTWPRGLAAAPLYWAGVAGPWLAWLALLAWGRRPRRRPAAGREAAEVLAAARSDVATRGSEAAPDAVRAVERALELRYGVALAGLASVERRRRLGLSGASPAVVEGSEAARSALEGARFGGAGLDRALAELERLERAMDDAGSARHAGARGATVIALAAALAAGSAAAGSADSAGSPALVGLALAAQTRDATADPSAKATAAWREANEAYRRGDMATAARAFDALARRHDDPRLTANLAAALWRQGRRGEALARYRAALALAPRDPAIRRDEQRLWSELGRPPRATQPVRALGAVRLDEILLLLLAASWVAAGAVALAQRRKRGRPFAAAATAGVLALAAVAALHALALERPRRAVATAGAELRAAPGGERIGVLPEGALVRVLEWAPAGWRVRADGHPAGWVAPDRIAPLD